MIKNPFKSAFNCIYSLILAENNAICTDKYKSNR